MKRRALREMPEEERPRERLLRSGPQSLSDAELLAIFIRTGTRGRDALEVARELLEKKGGLVGVARCGSAEELLASVSGIGVAKACEILAATEIARRIAAGESRRIKLDSPAKVYEMMAPQLHAMRVESFWVLLLNTRLELIRVVEVSQGILNQTLVHPREVFRTAILDSAYAVLLVHNHPSGDSQPSQADREVTRQLAQAGKVIGIELKDHIIIGDASGGRQPFFSFQENGLL